MLSRSWTLVLAEPRSEPVVLVVPEADSDHPDEVGIVWRGMPLMITSRRLVENLQVVRSDLQYHVQVALERWQQEMDQETARVLGEDVPKVKPSDLGAAGGALPPDEEEPLDVQAT